MTLELEKKGRKKEEPEFIVSPLRLTNRKQAPIPVIQEDIEIKGKITDQKTRKVGYNNSSPMLRFPPGWLDRLLKEGAEPYVEITRIIESDGDWGIIIRRCKEETPIG